MSPSSRALVSSLAALLSAAAAAEDPCRQWKREVVADNRYVAKLTFHRIDVTYDGEVINNQRDEKEIREGEAVRLGEIECEGRTVDLEVFAREREVKNKLRLLLGEEERAAKGAAALQELLEVVLARPAG